MLLDYYKIHKKQKFSTLDIAESQVKRCGLFHIFNLVINIIIFKCANPETLDYYYFAN